ncbi:MAG: holo-ACP synthase [Candidatus Omnitrophica bacterium]|nr:holo-ACP synthase [Candidatus Omnitrophota bacterium]
MILGTGVDIVEICRIRKAADKWKDKFLNRVFTDKELRYANGKKFIYQHLAARFAAKEAVLKAFGDSSINDMEWKNIEIVNNSDGRPIVILKGQARKTMVKRGISDVIVSLSHTRNYAVANAILVSA